MNSYPTISLCMIAKNEESIISQAIKSVQPLVSEIILVDTGSSDKTVAIARDLGAKVFFRKWDDDFSAPRNLSIEKATGDRILVLDADEAIAGEDLEELKRLTVQEDTCWRFVQRHYTEDHCLRNFHPCRAAYPAWERDHSGYFTSRLIRLFPNHCGIHYQGRVHELVEHSLKKLPQFKVVQTGIPIHHYGYLDTVRQEKNQLYTPLGRKKIEAQPDSWKNNYEIAVAYNCAGRKKESAAAFLRTVQLNPDFEPAWTNLGYVLCELGDYRKAFTALKRAIQIRPRSPEAHCNLGVVFMRTKRWQDAAECFRHAIRFKPGYVNALTNLGQTLLRTGQCHAARKTMEQALALHPKNMGIKTDLACVCLQHDTDRAEMLLKEVISSAPGDPRAYFYLGQLYEMKKYSDAAIALFEKFCALEQGRFKGDPPKKVKELIAAVEKRCAALK